MYFRVGLVAVLLAQFSGCSFLGNSKSGSKFSLDGFRKFKDCGEIAQYVSTARRVVVAQSANSEGTTGSSINADGQTNLQEAGVDEKDDIKVTQDAIFVARENDVVVIDRATKTERGILSFEAWSSPSMYVTSNKLVIILARSGAESVDVKFYDFKEGTMPVLVSTASVSGWLKESRVNNGRLLLIMSNWFPSDFSPSTPDLLGAPCEKTVVPYLEQASEQSFLPTTLTSIHALDIKSHGEDRDLLNILDDAQQIYASVGHIFLSKSLYRWETGKNQTHIRQIDLNIENGSLDISAVGVIDGVIKNKWAFKYFEDKRALAVATSSFISGVGENRQTNYLQTLVQENQVLKVAGKLEGFGVDEDIRAMRYVDNMAYAVTFKKTDPLFAIDLSDVNSPKLMGELKVPGFSTMLRPLGQGQMLGVGFDAADMGNFSLFQGVQVSLFDVSEPENPARLDVKINGSRGSSSEATFDHHALFYDADNKIVGIPMNVFGNPSEINGSNYGEFKSSGAVFYKINDGHLDEMTRISHADIMSSSCLEARKTNVAWWSSENKSFDVRRIVSLDGEILTVSPFGIKFYDPDLANMMHQIVFSGDSVTCLPRHMICD